MPTMADARRSNLANGHLADHFNQYVEADILFWMKVMTFHLLDRCARWHAGCDVESKTEECLMNAIYTH